MSSEPTDLSHLHPSVHAAALGPDQDRLRAVRADRWIGYDRATDALTRLEVLLHGRPSSACPTC